MSLDLPDAGDRQEAAPGLRLSCPLLWSHSVLRQVLRLGDCPREDSPADLCQLRKLQGPGSPVVQDIVFPQHQALATARAQGLGAHLLWWLRDLPALRSHPGS